MSALRSLAVLATIAISAPLAGCSASSSAGSGGMSGQGAPTQDIVATATAAGNFTTLAKALAAADLVKTLQGPGPFTVFAPTDAAFAKLPAATLGSLLEPANKAQLTDVLTYHVVAGDVQAADVVKLTAAKTVEGKSISIAVVDGKVVLNGNVNVVMTDVEASNGVIHVIDAVLLPPAQ